jgi:CrcB protein
MLGALLAGICLALSARLSESTRLFVVTGILGGLTTFSALSAETVTLALFGSPLQAVSYGISSLVAGIAACAFGYWVGQYIGLAIGAS